MTGEVDGNRLRTALVVLAVPPGAPGEPQKVRNWFIGKGFDVDPVVGISFAISGPGRLFSQVLGIADPGASREYGPSDLTGRLDRDLIPYVTAVVVGTAPDFGPGNP